MQNSTPVSGLKSLFFLLGMIWKPTGVSYTLSPHRQKKSEAACVSICVCVWTSSLTSLSCPKHSFKSKGGSHRRGWRSPWGSQFNFLHTSQVFSSSTDFWTSSRCGCVSLPALAWSKTCQEAYENAMKDMKWAGLCLRVCSPAREPVFVLWLFWDLYNLSSAVSVKEVRDIDIHGHQTWAPFLPSSPPAFIHSRHISFFPFIPFSLHPLTRGLGDGSLGGSLRLSQ